MDGDEDVDDCDGDDAVDDLPTAATTAVALYASCCWLIVNFVAVDIDDCLLMLLLLLCDC